jgi:hypothetical protein
VGRRPAAWARQYVFSRNLYLLDGVGRGLKCGEGGERESQSGLLIKGIINTPWRLVGEAD